MVSIYMVSWLRVACLRFKGNLFCIDVAYLIVCKTGQRCKSQLLNWHLLTCPFAHCEPGMKYVSTWRRYFTDRVTDLPKSQVSSSEWKTERAREDESGDSEDGEDHAQHTCSSTTVNSGTANPQMMITITGARRIFF